MLYTVHILSLTQRLHLCPPSSPNHHHHHHHRPSRNSVRKKPNGNWITDTNWLNAIQLSQTIPLFKDLPESIIRGESQWKGWCDLEAPEAQRVPDFEDRLDKMHRMLVIRGLRSDRTMIVSKEYIAGDRTRPGPCMPDSALCFSRHPNVTT